MTRRRRRDIADALARMDVAVIGLVATGTDLQCAVHQLRKTLDEQDLTITATGASDDDNT